MSRCGLPPVTCGAARATVAYSHDAQQPPITNQEVAVAAGPTRRAMLAASAAAVPLLVSACRGIQVLGTPPPPGRDVRALQSAISGERALISSYHSAIAQATAAGSGDRATVASLSRLLAEHHQHLAQLTARLVEPSRSAAPPVKPTPSASAPAG